MSTAVLWHVRPSDTGRQLIMFPYLGGFGASFNRVIECLDGDWDVWTVNPAGHGPSDEPAHTTLAGMVGSLLSAAVPVLRPRAVLFGHSMGGMIAYHALRALAADPRFAGRVPSDLVLSASCATRDLPVVGYADLPERALLDHLLSFDAFPREFAHDRQLIDMFLPAFRADYRVLAEARRLEPERVDVEALLLLGSEDPHTPADTAEAWQAHLARPLRTHVFEGAGHMFVQDAPQLVAGQLAEMLRDVEEAPAGAFS